MARWTSGGRERLQHAAMALFHDRGYDVVTIAEIAHAAGLTKRSFFNHFPDKPEVVFAGAEQLEADVVRHLEGRDAGDAPFDSAIAALAAAGSGLVEVVAFARMRRDLIDSSTELQERDLAKRASLAATVARVLVDSGVPPMRAALAAAAAVAVFDTSFTAWAEDPTAAFGGLMLTGAHELRAGVLPSSFSE